MDLKVGFVDELEVSQKEVRDFYEQNWPRKIALSDEKFYQWQFMQPPTGEQRDFCVIAYNTEAKKMMGVMGLSKRPFSLNGRILNGAELTTWIVSKDAVGGGIGGKILSKIQSHFDALIGMGISQMALPLYMRSDFRFVKAIPRFVRVVNFENIREHATADLLATKLIQLWAEKGRGAFYSEKATQSSIDRANSHLVKNFNTYVRDSAHLSWRYDQHPYFDYRQFNVKSHADDINDGVYVCLREEKSLDEFKILHVMDVFGEKANLPAAVYFIEDYARKNGFDVVDFYCTSTAVSSHLLQNGWFSINDDACFQFPHLFHPVEMRHPPTTSFVYWTKEGLSEISDLAKFYLTKEDADLDRPTTFGISKSERI